MHRNTGYVALWETFFFFFFAFPVQSIPLNTVQTTYVVC